MIVDNISLSMNISVVAAPAMVRVSGEESGMVGTLYSLTCRVRLPPGVFNVSAKVQWKRPNMPLVRASSISLTKTGFVASLQLLPLQSSDAGEYLCQASYSLGGYTSPLVNDSFTVNVTGKH